MSRILGISGKCIMACGLALALLVPLESAQATSFKVLHSFQKRPDGEYPFGDLIADGAGNLYGTTDEGGSCRRFSCGTVFKLAPDGTETVLRSFPGGPRGFRPRAGLTADSAGNLYGTTSQGGVVLSCSGGCGSVFKVTQSGRERVLYSFKGGAGDGSDPVANLLADSAGNLYGTTYYGGGEGCSFGCGTVFKLTPGGSEAVLHSFCSQANCADGSAPVAGLIADSAGNLYGTTAYGGGSACGGSGCGTVFKLEPDGTETVLHSFNGGKDGEDPNAGLILSNGSLYGTATGGGVNHFGTVFRLTP